MLASGGAMKARIVRHPTGQGAGHCPRRGRHWPLRTNSDPHNLGEIGVHLSGLIGRFGRHEQVDGSTSAALGRDGVESQERITHGVLPQDEPRSRQPILRC